MLRNLAACGGNGPRFISFIFAIFSGEVAIPTIILGLNNDSSDEDGEVVVSSKAVTLLREAACGDA